MKPLLKTLASLSMSLGALALPAGAGAATHALIMGIGDYEDIDNRLPGIDKDLENARFIARKLGVRSADILELKNEQVTLDGIRDAFDTLADKVEDGDSVFVYYSGHGSRKKRDGKCAESLVTYEKNYFADSDLERILAELSGKAGKLVVFLDACHSGGATRSGARNMTVAAAKDPATPVPKFLPGDQCSVPSNARNLTVAAGPAADNFVSIAAARADEVAFASPEGSWATLAWRRCLEDGRADRDGSGGVSAEELKACAQNQIDRQPTAPGDRPHHVTLVGNTGAVLNLNAPSRDKNLGVEAATPNLAATLEDIYRSRDARWKVSVDLERDVLRIGEDRLNFKVASAKAGYVYVLMVGSDSHTFDVLFPNARDRDNRIEARQTLELPRPSWELRASGPEGRDRLLVLVTARPRDFSGLAATPAGPFSSIEATGDSVSAIQDAIGVLGEDCSGAACRYGAQLVTVREER